MRPARALVLVFGVLALAGCSLAGAAPAFAAGTCAGCSPWWELTSSAAPTNLPPGGEGEIIARAINLGDAATSTSPAVALSDDLPAGLKVLNVGLFTTPTGNVANLGAYCHTEALPLTSTKVTCSVPEGLVPKGLQPYQNAEIRITVKVEAGAPASSENEVTVAGGGAPGTSIRRPLTVSDEPTPFGVEDYQLTPENEGGSLETQAGSHPFQLTTTLALNQAFTFARYGKTFEPTSPALAKDLHFNLPVGLVGNPTVFPQCTDLQFETRSESNIYANQCPSDTVMGVATVTVNIQPGGFEFITEREPLYNLTPSVGEPARFGFDALGNLVILDTSVRTGSDYGVVVSVDNNTQTANFLSTEVTFWGVPGDPRHNSSRGLECLKQGKGCTETVQSQPQSFLTLPTSCTGALETSVEADAWTQPGFLTAGPSEPEESLDGCNQLPFAAGIAVAPDLEAASTPTGLTVGVKVPQGNDVNAEGLSESDVKSIAVALPAGVQISPSGGNGLEACSDAQIGFTGFAELNPLAEPGVKTPQFTPGRPSCPDASKVATVSIHSPLLPEPLEGAVYLAAPQNFTGPPQENPFESLVAMYIVAEDPVAGVLVKLPVKVSPDQVTGQLTATVDSPQLPFENAELHFFGGERAPLSTPALCGTYTTQTSITPWSGNAAVEPSSSFDITSGPNGAPCADPQPFSPGFQAGSTNLQAGAFTPFTMTMTRPDADQTLGRIEMQMPPGLLGTLSTVKLCGEAAANAGTCGQESLIGSTVVSAGLGSDPYTVTGGKVYITEAYGGGQFGLSIVNPAAAGPFVLDEGRPVVVRAAIFIDPHTAALRIVSDPLPTMLDGIPLQLQHVNVTIERPGGRGFTFNPTSCAKMAIGATISSSQGVSAGESSPFQVTNCASLKFEPKFAVSTAGKTSKADGASLTAKLSYPNAPQGSQANIAKVKVDLPKQLPSRLTTLQKACTSARFEANPAGCPAASKIGYATVTTPLLPVPLTGPAIFVSHGGEAFPSLTMVLQGYGVTVDLVGTTFISKAGVTSTTFKTVPDTPFSTFELTLSQGKYSALAANVPASAKYSLCGQKLTMPTAFVAQNGAEIHETTPIAITGCAKAKSLTRAQKLKAALKECHKKQKSKRGNCEKVARKKFGTVSKKQGKR